MNNISVIDMIFFILIILMIIHGYVKGFIGELFSWAALVLAIFGAVFLYPAGAEFIRTKAFQNVRYVPEILAFIAIFIVIMLLIKILEYMLKDVAAGAILGGVNKLLGAVFGLVEGVALTAIILFVFTIQPVFDVSKILEDSILARILLPLIQIPFGRGSEVINSVYLLLPGTKFPV